ncbi:PREDICTED: uncharacterized protein LOC105452896 [Wasmannia auropunctata]|uniref:uncharacterized protein LOC105452896 n=1 Tax=Wasmannia auropunctata TaxID=64793 RepID=UPI0005F0BC5E|nr:PREDICTED: uncharacterized protein LOC105452896 [Wasmannia auropunctata]
MSPFLRMKKKQKLKEWTTTKGNIVPFSYTLAYPLLRHQNHFCVSWKIIEKGSKKAKLSQRYKISSIAIRIAKIKIGRYILGTPHFESMLFCQGFNIYFKGEVHQITGSIKARGVVYSLLQLTSEQKQKGVIAISTGSFSGRLFSLLFWKEA